MRLYYKKTRVQLKCFKGTLVSGRIWPLRPTIKVDLVAFISINLAGSLVSKDVNTAN